MRFNPDTMRKNILCKCRALTCFIQNKVLELYLTAITSTEIPEAVRRQNVEAKQ